MTADFSRLDKLMHAYFHQDYELFGSTIAEVFDSYRENSTVDELSGLRSDIARFLARHNTDLDATFQAAYGYDFDPQLWDLTAESFLRLLLSLMESSPN